MTRLLDDSATHANLPSEARFLVAVGVADLFCHSRPLIEPVAGLTGNP